MARRELGSDEMLQLWLKYTEFQARQLSPSTIQRDYGKIAKRLCLMPELSTAVAVRDWLTAPTPEWCPASIRGTEMFKVGDKVYRKEAPGKRGIVCEICPTTGRYRVQWGGKRTWNRGEFLVLVKD